MIHVTRVGGYGGLKLTLESGEWPRRIRVVFLGEDDIWEASVHYGDLEFSTTREDAPKTRRSKKGKELDRDAKDAAIEMPFSFRDGNPTVELPRILLDRREKMVEFYWSANPPP